MGSFRKLVRQAAGVFTGNTQLNMALGSGGGGPGEAYQSPDPYGGGVQWDETGRPIGRMPRGQYALDYQYEADRRTQQQRNALWGDAQQALRQGQGLLESYRPGGAAALASGIHGQRAGLYAQQSMALQSPDLLMGYREHKQAEADYERKQAQEQAQFMSLIGAGASLLGMGLGGGAGAAAAAGGAAGSYINNQGGMSPAPGQTGYMGQQRGGQTMFGPGWGNTPYRGGPTFQAQLGDSPGPQGQPAQGGAGQPAGGGSQPQQGQSGQGQGGAQGGAGGPQQAMLDGGGGQPMSTFQSGEAASLAMAQMAPPDVYSRWRQDEDRQEFTYLMQQSAASRVLAAMRA